MATLLAVAIIMSLSVCAFAADLTGKYKVYTCLGDSNANGYSTTDYQGDMLASKDAYHTKLAQALGAELYPYGYAGFRTQEMRYLLNPDYQITDWTFADNCPKNPLHQPDLDAVNERYIAAVEAADLITVQVGTNNFISYLWKYHNVRDTSNEYDFTPLKEIFSGDDIISRVMLPAVETVEHLYNAVEMLTFCAKMMPKIYADFQEDWDDIIRNIYRINPDVTLVTISVNNIYNSTVISEDIPIKIGTLLDPFYAKFNDYIKYSSPYADEYLYCDLTDIPLGEDLSLQDGIEMPTASYAVKGSPRFHMSDDEHTVATEKILEVLEAYEDGTYNVAVTPSQKVEAMLKKIGAGSVYGYLSAAKQTIGRLLNNEKW